MDETGLVCLYIENIEKRENFLFLPKKNFQNGLSCLLCSHTVRSQEKTSIEDKCKAGWARRCFKNTFDYSLSLSRCDGQLCFSSRSLLTCSTTGTVSNVIKIDMHLVLFQQRIWHRRFLVFVQNIFHTDCKDCGDVRSKRWHHFQKASARPFPSHGDSSFSQKHLNSQLFNQNGNQEEQTCKIGFSICIFLDNSCQVKKNTQKLFFCPMQRPAMARRKYKWPATTIRGQESDASSGELPPLPAHQTPICSRISEMYHPHTRLTSFSCVFRK